MPSSQQTLWRALEKIGQHDAYRWVSPPFTWQSDTSWPALTLSGLRQPYRWNSRESSHATNLVASATAREMVCHMTIKVNPDQAVDPPDHWLCLRRREWDDKSTISRTSFAGLPASWLVFFLILHYKTSNDCTISPQTTGKPSKQSLCFQTDRVVTSLSQLSTLWGPLPRLYRRVFASLSLESPALYSVFFRGSSMSSIRAMVLRIHDWSSPYQWLPLVSYSLSSFFHPSNTHFTASHWISPCLSAG